MYEVIRRDPDRDTIQEILIFSLKHTTPATVLRRWHKSTFLGSWDKKLQSFLPLYILTENANSYSFKLHSRSRCYAGLIPVISHLSHSHLVSNPRWQPCILCVDISQGDKVGSPALSVTRCSKRNTLQDVSHCSLPSVPLWPLSRTGDFTIHCSCAPFLCTVNYLSYVVYLSTDGDLSVFCYDLNTMLTQ